MENLYSYIFWFNHHEGLWYAIDRNTEIEFFNGNRNESIHYKSTQITTLIEILSSSEKTKNMIDGMQW